MAWMATETMIADARKEWTTYASNAGYEDVGEWDDTELGDWAWAECVAWANIEKPWNKRKSMDDMRDWLIAQAMATKNDTDISTNMVLWAFDYAMANDLGTAFSIM